MDAHYSGVSVVSTPSGNFASEAYQQASGYLTGTNLLRRPTNPQRPHSGQLAALTNLTSIGTSAGNGLGAPPSSDGFPALPGAATPSAASITSLWRNSARTIGDILVLSDIISPTSYLALPFAVQPFYVASCCYVKGALISLIRDPSKLIC